MKILTATRNAMAQVLADRITAGSGSSWALKFYTGTAPAAVGDAHAGTLLASVANDDDAPPVTNGAITPYAFDTTNAAASGTVGYAAVADTDGVDVCFLTCGLAGSGSGVELDSLDFIASAPVVINAFSIPVGA